MGDNRYEAPVPYQTGGPEASYVVHGATMQCTYGSQTSMLILDKSHGIYLRGAAQLNIDDYRPYVNIPTFGVCSRNNALCTPLLSGSWIGGKDDVLIDGVPALINTCTNTCTSVCSKENATITIVNDGQMNES